MALDNKTTFYQIWSLAYDVCELKSFAKYLADNGYNAVYFTPLFESENHGYDTKDYRKIDPRIGSNSEFADLVSEYHKYNIKVYVDGVFNHVGREFFAFQDVLNNKEKSRYASWFKDISFSDFDPESSIKYFPDDCLGYNGWEGNFDLVELNHSNDELSDYLIDCAKFWVDEFGIDGIRLDVAYSLPTDFLTKLHGQVYVPMIGEMIHGDYKRIIDTGIDSVTDYNLYKALWSSVKEKNLNELNWTLNKHQDEYQGLNLFTFLDNHDVSRVASRFLEYVDEYEREKLLEITLKLLFYVPGTPCIYYGTEIPEISSKVEGQADSDLGIRPHLGINNLQSGKWVGLIKDLILQKQTNPNLQGFDYICPYISNEQMVFLRDENYILVNLSKTEAYVKLGDEVDTIISKREFQIPPLSCVIL